MLEPMDESDLPDLVQSDVAIAWQLIEDNIVGDCGTSSESYQSNELTAAIYLVRERLGIPD
jgi:hypothetical protein